MTMSAQAWSAAGRWEALRHTALAKSPHVMVRALPRPEAHMVSDQISNTSCAGPAGPERWVMPPRGRALPRFACPPGSELCGLAVRASLRLSPWISIKMQVLGRWPGLGWPSLGWAGPLAWAGLGWPGLGWDGGGLLARRKAAESGSARCIRCQDV